MAAPEPIGRPALDRLDKLLATDASHDEANDRDAKILAGRRLPDDSNPVMGGEEPQQDLLEPFLVSGHLGPRLAGGWAKVRDDGGDTLSQFVVGRCQVEFEIQRVRGLEEVSQRLDLVVDARGSVELGQVWAVHLVPGEGLEVGSMSVILCKE